jgi:glycosyltransferase involved in cell wall biosynthesis
MLELAIIVPCFNESEVLLDTRNRLLDVMNKLILSGKISDKSSIWFIDDGSMDSTWAFIESYTRENASIHGIKLSRNWGHQAAILAGLLNVPGDAIISVDADLQDDLSIIDKMIDEHQAGSEIVFGVKASRKVDPKIKHLTAEFYNLLLRAMGVNIVFNHADFRFMSRNAIEGLRDYQEVNLFLRGIVPLIGFKTSKVYYEVLPRKAGKTKYSMGKMVSLALDGITSFSPFPLRIITLAGFFVAMASFLVGIWTIIVRLFTDLTVAGWTSIVVPIYFLGGIQLLSIGIIGEYISKIYLETKKRPRFIIEKVR